MVAHSDEQPQGQGTLGSKKVGNLVSGGQWMNLVEKCEQPQRSYRTAIGTPAQMTVNQNPDRGMSDEAELWWQSFREFRKQAKRLSVAETRLSHRFCNFHRTNDRYTVRKFRRALDADSKPSVASKLAQLHPCPGQ